MNATDQTYALRFEDGKMLERAGPNVFVPKALFGWPLPGRLATLSHDASPNAAFWDADDVAGAGLPPEITESENVEIYRKSGESQLPEDVPGILRGATYRLEADGG